MVTAVSPVVGQWYRYLGTGKAELFRVVDIDADESTVEVQYFDGDIEELSQEDWNQQGVENCAAPEDWTGPYDEIDRDDLGYSDTDTTGEGTLRTVQGATTGVDAAEDEGPGDEPG